MFMQRPQASREREARALTKLWSDEDHEGVPSEANTDNLLLPGKRGTKADRLVDEMVKDHKVLNKFHNMFTMQDIERLGGEMTQSVLTDNVHYVHEDLTSSYTASHNNAQDLAIGNTRSSQVSLQ